jgi:hypothetical protein
MGEMYVPWYLAHDQTSLTIFKALPETVACMSTVIAHLTKDYKVLATLFKSCNGEMLHWPFQLSFKRVFYSQASNANEKVSEWWHTFQ